MTTTEDQVTFRLWYFCRFDATVEAFVGYVPRLQIYAQSPTESGLQDAVTASALRFILASADRNILGEIMQQSKMHEISPVDAEVVVASENSEFVSIDGYKECPTPIEVTLPFSAFVLEGIAVA